MLQMKTVSVALVLCLNVGVDPPDVVKTTPCARLECWIGESWRSLGGLRAGGRPSCPGPEGLAPVPVKPRTGLFRNLDLHVGRTYPWPVVESVSGKVSKSRLLDRPFSFKRPCVWPEQELVTVQQ